MTNPEKAYDAAFRNEREERGCAQSTMKAIMETLDQWDSGIYQAMTGFSAGGACLGDGSCGAYIAGIYSIGRMTGRRREDLRADPQDPRGSSRNRDNYELAGKLHDRFIDEYGSVICCQIHRKLYGRPFYIVDPDEKKKFDDAGAHDWGCSGVCGKGAQWAVEIMEEHLARCSGERENHG